MQVCPGVRMPEFKAPLCYLPGSQDRISLLFIFLSYKMGIIIVLTSSGCRFHICKVLRKVSGTYEVLHG